MKSKSSIFGLIMIFVILCYVAYKYFYEKDALENADVVKGWVISKYGDRNSNNLVYGYIYEGNEYEDRQKISIEKFNDSTIGPGDSILIRVSKEDPSVTRIVSFSLE